MMIYGIPNRPIYFYQKDIIVHPTPHFFFGFFNHSRKRVPVPVPRGIWSFPKMGLPPSWRNLNYPFWVSPILRTPCNSYNRSFFKVTSQLSRLLCRRRGQLEEAAEKDARTDSPQLIVAIRCYTLW